MPLNWGFLVQVLLNLEVYMIVDKKKAKYLYECNCPIKVSTATESLVWSRRASSLTFAELTTEVYSEGEILNYEAIGSYVAGQAQ